MYELGDRLIREEECEKITGLSRTTRWRYEKAGTFPKRRRVGPSIIGWRLSEINEWLNAL
mgnify:FL=1|jgi:prophage regulatory protein